MARLGSELVGAAQNAIGGILGGAGRLVAGTFNTFIMLFGMLFIAVYLLVDERKIKAAYLGGDSGRRASGAPDPRVFGRDRR